MRPALVIALALLAPLPAAAEGGRPGEAGAGKGVAKTLGVGDEVKDLLLPLAEGGNWSAAAARGKAVVMVFAGSWSAESMEALRRLGDPKGRLAGKAELLGVLRDVGAEKAKEAAAAAKVAVRVAADPRRRAYDLFASRGLPYTVVIDRDGKVALSAGGYDEEAVAAKLEALARTK